MASKNLLSPIGNGCYLSIMAFLKKIWVIAFLLFACLAVDSDQFSMDGPGLFSPRYAVADSIKSGARERPKPFDHIFLTWAGNPATSQAVTWRSFVESSKPMAEIATATSSTGFAGKASQIPAVTSSLKINNQSVYYHSVNFTDLKPNTLYAYRVGNGDIWSEWFQFRTAGTDAEPFSFLYLADAQNEISSLWSRTIRAAILHSPGIRFMIHTGDMVDPKNSPHEWNEWFNAGSWVFASIPSLPATGNHEYKIYRGQGRELSKFWRPQFTLPENDIPVLAETYYHLDYQGARFVVLNSNRKIEKQARWLEKVLGDNPHRWTIVTLHHPVYSSVRGRDNKLVREQWSPLFNKFNVDLVLQGHDHVYTRGYAPGKSGGPVYVTSVSGPKMYKLARREWMARAGEGLQLFQVISIDGDVLNFTSVTVTGEVYDAFDLIKKDGNAGELINKPHLR